MSGCRCASPPRSVLPLQITDPAGLPVMGFTQGLCTRNAAGHFSCAVPVNDASCTPTGQGDYACGVWTRSPQQGQPAYAGEAACQRLSDTLLTCLVPPRACGRDGACVFGAPPGR